MQVPRMPDLEPNPNYRPPTEEKPKKKVVRRNRKKTTRAIAPSAPKRELPGSSVSQPRDHLGRFAVKAGQVLWGAARGTARATVGTVKDARKVHKVINNQQKQARRRQNIELRERAVAVKEREKQVRRKR